MGTIHGIVTLDGSPLTIGAVRLVPLSGDAQTAGGAIQDGKFAVQSKPTNYRVEISATQVQGSTARKIDKFAANDTVTVVALIPEKYNAKSELTLDVKPGLNEPHFDLQSR